LRATRLTYNSLGRLRVDLILGWRNGAIIW
jgi:hypothetical protein